MRNLKKDIQLYKNEIVLRNLEEFTFQNSCGAVVNFIGTVRDLTKGKSVIRLEFESYEKMALKEMNKIADSVIERWPIERIALHHRLGQLTISDIAVAISVSSPHRKAAFEACQYVIDTLKETVPIWKKEIFEDGEVWVSATP